MGNKRPINRMHNLVSIIVIYTKLTTFLNAKKFMLLLNRLAKITVRNLHKPKNPY